MNSDSNILEVSFRTIDDNDEVLRTDNINYSIVEEYGFDVKFAYNVFRLADEAEQILTLGEIDLQRGKERMKAIRRGEVSEEELRCP